MVRSVAFRPLFAALVAVVALLAGAGTGVAAAHSALTGSSPEGGASLRTAPDRVTLTFNEDLQKEYAVLRVVGPDNHFWEKGAPVIDGRTASATLDGLGPVGEYRINYRVTSADGHPVEGQVVFELTAPGDGTPGPVADDWQPSTDHGLGAGVIAGIVVAVVVAVAVVGAVAWVLIRRRGSADPR